MTSGPARYVKHYMLRTGLGEPPRPPSMVTEPRYLHWISTDLRTFVCQPACQPAPTHLTTTLCELLTATKNNDDDDTTLVKRKRRAHALICTS